MDKPVCEFSALEHNKAIHHLGSCHSCYSNKFIDYDQKENDRKAFVMAAIQGIMAGRSNETGMQMPSAARWAIELADELLKQLES
jgi:hypothetical protein